VIFDILWIARIIKEDPKEKEKKKKRKKNRKEKREKKEKIKPARFDVRSREKYTLVIPVRYNNKKIRARARDCACARFMSCEFIIFVDFQPRAA